MILTAAQVANALGERFNLGLQDIKAIRTAYASIDIEALRDKARKRIEVRDWKPGDVASTGKLWEEIHPELLTGAKAYSIWIDGALVYFQYAHPYTGQQMTTTAALEDAKAKHIENIIDDIVNAQLPELVIEEL